MTISIAEIATKVIGRLNNDTGSGGLRNVSAPLITGAFWEMAPSDQAEPYIVYGVELVSGGIDSAEHFEGNGVKCQVTLDVYVKRWVTSVNAMDRLSAILARLYGDSGANSGVPGFGFHRWTMSGLTGWTATNLEFITQGAIRDDADRVAVTTTFQAKAITQSW